MGLECHQVRTFCGEEQPRDFGEGAEHRAAEHAIAPEGLARGRIESVHAARARGGAYCRTAAGHVQGGAVPTRRRDRAVPALRAVTALSDAVLPNRAAPEGRSAERVAAAVLVRRP